MLYSLFRKLMLEEKKLLYFGKTCTEIEQYQKANFIQLRMQIFATNFKAIAMALFRSYSNGVGLLIWSLFFLPSLFPYWVRNVPMMLALIGNNFRPNRMVSWAIDG